MEKFSNCFRKRRYEKCLRLNISNWTHHSNDVAKICFVLNLLDDTMTSKVTFWRTSWYVEYTYSVQDTPLHVDVMMPTARKDCWKFLKFKFTSDSLDSQVMKYPVKYYLLYQYNFDVHFHTTQNLSPDRAHDFSVFRKFNLQFNMLVLLWMLRFSAFCRWSFIQFNSVFNLQSRPKVQVFMFFWFDLCTFHVVIVVILRMFNIFVPRLRMNKHT